MSVTVEARCVCYSMSSSVVCVNVFLSVICSNLCLIVQHSRLRLLREQMSTLHAFFANKVKKEPSVPITDKGSVQLMPLETSEKSVDAPVPETGGHASMNDPSSVAVAATEPVAKAKAVAKPRSSPASKQPAKKRRRSAASVSGTQCVQAAGNGDTPRADEHVAVSENVAETATADNVSEEEQNISAWLETLPKEMRDDWLPGLQAIRNSIKSAKSSSQAAPPSAEAQLPVPSSATTEVAPASIGTQSDAGADAMLRMSATLGAAKQSDEVQKMTPQERAQAWKKFQRTLPGQNERFEDWQKKQQRGPDRCPEDIAKRLHLDPKLRSAWFDIWARSEGDRKWAQARYTEETKLQNIKASQKKFMWMNRPQVQDFLRVWTSGMRCMMKPRPAQTT